MDPIVLNDLQILVERFVRPVRASLKRKAKMRQELLSTVISEYQTQLARGQEKNRALELCSKLLEDRIKARTRFQRSLDWLESICDSGMQDFLELAIMRHRKSFAGFRRIGIIIIISWLFYPFLLIPLNYFQYMDRASIEIVLGMTAAVSLYALLFLCAMSVLLRLLLRAIGRSPVPHRPQILLVLLLAASLLPSFYFGIRFLASGLNFSTTLVDTLRYLPAFAVAVPYCLLVIVRLLWILEVGKLDEKWPKQVFLEFKWVLPLTLFVFASALVISNDLVVAFRNAWVITGLTIFWIAPIAVALSKPSFMRAFRICLEWERLSIEEEAVR